MKKITVEMLREHGGHCNQVEVFEEIFPDGAPVTMRSLKKARDARLNIVWSKCLLSDPALEKYKKAQGRAWKKYQKVQGRALIKALKESE